MTASIGEEGIRERGSYAALIPYRHAREYLNSRFCVKISCCPKLVGATHAGARVAREIRFGPVLNRFRLKHIIKGLNRPFAK